MPAVSMFHKPLKKEISDAIQKPRPPRPRPPPPPPPPPPKPETDDPPAPSGSYQDYKIISVARTAWKYDVMKFDARGKEIDPTKWEAPVKLNRKSGRLPDNDVEPVPIELKPMLGPDGKPVIGVDGKVVMVGPDGKVPQQAGGVNGKVNGKDALKGKGKGRQPFKKKTRQVHRVPEDVLQLRREEKYPWVMEEGGENGQVWTGRLEDSDRAKTYALLVPLGQDFQFVPAHRWYKFQKRPSYKILALEEAEAEYARAQKNKDPERWLMRKKAANGSGPSEATLATFKREKLERKPEMAEEDGGDTLRTVDKGEDDLFGDDDDDEGGRNRKRKEKEGFEGDADEVEYEDDMSDDEEKQDLEGEDEEAKELEERLKREYRQANKMRDGHIDEDEDEDDIDMLTGAGKDLKKLVKRTEKNEAYDSDDDEKNPYISEEEEPEDETPQPVPEGPAVMNQTPSQPASGAATPTNRPLTPRPSKPATSKPIQPLPGSSQPRAASPGLGNAVVAQRATSPKVPTKSKQRPVSGSRPGSPLASRASSPVPAPALTVNPPASSIVSGSASPTSLTATPLPATQTLKRKAVDDASTPGASTSATTTGPDGKPRKKAKRQLEEAMVIEFLKENGEATTKGCIQKFQQYLKTDEAKKAFTGMVKKVAVVKKNGTLKLRPEYL